MLEFAPWFGVLATLGVGMYAVNRARKAHRTAALALRIQVLYPVIQAYQSREMFLAVRALWDFKREHPDDLEDAARIHFEAESRQVDHASPSERVEVLRSTLDYQRRLVKNFYLYLSSLVEESGEVFDDERADPAWPLRDLVYSNWMRYDLAIIPEILLPMERAKGLLTGIELSDKVQSRLRALFENAPEFPSNGA